MKMLACCLLVMALAACEPPSKGPPPQTPARMKVVPKPSKEDKERALFDRKLGKIQDEVRALLERTRAER